MLLNTNYSGLSIMISNKKYLFLLIIISSAILLYFTYNMQSTNVLSSIAFPTTYKEIKRNKYELEDFQNTRDNVFFDIKINNKYVGRIEIELFDDEVPITAQNFRYLCQNQDLNYRNNIFHRTIPGYLIQGGDIVNHDGSSGFSAYGKYFKDENFNLKHNQEGLLSMANCGTDKNNSQFFILTHPKGYADFDDKFVVFGIIIKGYEIVKKMEYIRIDSNYKPKFKCEISDCGLVVPESVTDEDDEDILNDVSDKPIKLSI